MRKYMHKLIKWYLIKFCGGAFHTGAYGSKEGYYVCIYNDSKYGYLQKLQIADMEHKVKW